MQQAEIIAVKHKKKFPLVPYEDLKSEAIAYLLEYADAPEALRWTKVYYRVQDFAYAQQGFSLRCNSDALEWLEWSFDDTSVSQLLYDCSLGLSSDAYNLIVYMLHNDLTEFSNKWGKVTRRSLRNSLVGSGATEWNARNLVNEIKIFWRDYVS